MQFFEDKAIQVGQEVAVHSVGYDWQVTFITEVDTEHQRIRCPSAKYVPTYRAPQTTYEERTQLLIRTSSGTTPMALS